MPKRVQRKRTKGWKMPPNCVSVTRPGPWGNPHRVGPWGKSPSAFQCVEFFRAWAVDKARDEPEWLAPLKGKDLACWCPIGSPCHADVLLALANREG